MKINHLYLGNCIEILEQEIEAESIDLIFADPPYNLSGKKLDLPNNTTGGAFYKMNMEWDSFSDNDYERFTKNWISRCYRVLKPTGGIYISCSYHYIAEILYIAKKIGFKINNIITWYKTNAMPNITKRTFTHSTEFVCWLVKGKGWTFNYEEMKMFNPEKTKDGQNKQMRDFISIPIVQGKERIKEHNGRASHPTQKPELLLEMIIKASSNEGDIVLDPFLGTGTTCVVANKLSRNWIGIEIDKKYLDISKKRIEESI
jgi:site-specific DNA-methyltransferase (adenine-specific)/modification methylase